MPKNVADTPFFEPSPVSYIIDPGWPLLIRSQTLVANRIVRPHTHPRGQYAWARKGVLRVVSDHSVWIVPPTHAVWIPGGTRHQVASETRAEVRHVFVDPSRAVRVGAPRPDHCAVLAVTPLMRELTLRLEAILAEEADEARRLRFCDVVIDELDRLDEAPLNSARRPRSAARPPHPPSWRTSRRPPVPRRTCQFRRGQRTHAGAIVHRRNRPYLPPLACPAAPSRRHRTIGAGRQHHRGGAVARLFIAKRFHGKFPRGIRRTATHLPARLRWPALDR